MIKKESIENLKNHLDVVDVISQFIEIKKSGANFKACCPFHGESTPSFVISPAKQIYHCFGCGVGGDSIKFVMEYEKLSYPETIEKLASMYNFNLEYDANVEKKSDIKILEDISKYYQKLYTNNNIVREYVHNRGISEFSIEKFEIGYAPSSLDTVNFLKSNHYNLTEAIELGVIDTGTNGLYARFIERITFPIYTISGKLVGFGGRTITGHNAKYVNSPQTKLFNKSRLLYGYHLAKESIYKKNQIIVCEGYLDVIMLHQAGFNTAVATLGTALTTEHLPLLRRGEPKVIVAYDGDKAGINAAYKASVMLSQGEFDGGVIIFSDGQDPADMVKANKIEELNKILSAPIAFIPFVIDCIISKYDINNPAAKQKALNEANDYLKTLSLLNQDEYKRYLAQKLNIKEERIKISSDKQRNNVVNLSKIDIAEISVIKYILENNKVIDEILDIVDVDMFEYCKDEFLLCVDNPSDERLNKFLLNEKIINYTYDELKNQLFRFLVKYYEKKLLQLSYDKDLDFKQKANLIRKIKDNIYQLKQGKLVSYNL